MLKVAICDDESLMAGEISDRLSRYMQDRRMTPYSVGSFSSGRSLLESGYDIAGYPAIGSVFGTVEDKAIGNMGMRRSGMGG